MLLFKTQNHRGERSCCLSRVSNMPNGARQHLYTMSSSNPTPIWQFGIFQLAFYLEKVLLIFFLLLAVNLRRAQELHLKLLCHISGVVWVLCAKCEKPVSVHQNSSELQVNLMLQTLWEEVTALGMGGSCLQLAGNFSCVGFLYIFAYLWACQMVTGETRCSFWSKYEQSAEHAGLTVNVCAVWLHCMKLSLTDIRSKPCVVWGTFQEQGVRKVGNVLWGVQANIWLLTSSKENTTKLPLKDPFKKKTDNNFRVGVCCVSYFTVL